VCAVFGGWAWFIEGKMHWTDYGYLTLSSMYLALFLYECKSQNFRIGNIEKNALFGKKLHITEISLVKQFAGDYILRADNQELGMETEIEAEKSLGEQKYTK
jgi:hypothetical protein